MAWLNFEREISFIISLLITLDHPFVSAEDQGILVKLWGAKLGG